MEFYILQSQMLSNNQLLEESFSCDNSRLDDRTNNDTNMTVDELSMTCSSLNVTESLQEMMARLQQIEVG